MKKSELKEFADVTGFGASKKELLWSAIVGISFLVYCGLAELLSRFLESL
jgi:hypothetical protein